jgi:hypothetical protein
MTLTTYDDDIEKQRLLEMDLMKHIWRSNVAPLIRPEIVDEHRERPFGKHSAPLDVLLYFLRSDPLPKRPRLVGVVIKFEQEWAVAEVSRDGQPQIHVRAERYASPEEVEHTIFLERLALATATFGPPNDACDQDTRNMDEVR